MRKFEQMAELIRQNISVIISQAEQQIKVISASATAEAFRIKQYAQVIFLNFLKLKFKNFFRRQRLTIRF